MGDWQVVGREGDPAPGDPDRVRELGQQLLREASTLDGNTTRLRGIATDSNGGGLRMKGDYAPKFTEALGQLPGELAKLSKAYRGCGNALTAYAGSLATAQQKADTALSNGRAADGRFQGAVAEIRSLLPPDRQNALTGNPRPSLPAVQSFIGGLDGNAQAQVRPALERARSANADRDRAKRLADEAARLRGDAETRCVKSIGDALGDSGIKNKSWLRKAANALSWPFKSWDNFVKFASVVAAVAGIAALFLSGPLGWAVMATALVAGGVILGDTLRKYSTGQASLGQVALDALGVIPGGRGVISLSKLGVGALAVTRVVARGGAGTRLAGPGAKAIGPIRGQLGRPRDFAQSPGLRRTFASNDPIDLASGAVLLPQTDFELPGLLPLTLERTHLSTYRAGRWFGPSWSSTLDQRLEIDEQGIFMLAAGGILLAYPHPDGAEPVFASEGPRLALRRHADGYTVTDPSSGQTVYFGMPGYDESVLPLTAITDRNGSRIDLRYGGDGMLTEVEHSGGYHLDVQTSQGRITGIRLRGRDGEPDLQLMRYGYDDAGNLAEVINTSGLPQRFGYDGLGRMTRWEDRNGTWYEYTYDIVGRCRRGTGSDGIFETTIDYDPGTRVTVQRDSLGRATTCHMNDASQVVKLVDPLGGATTYRWDRYDRPLAETDPLGRTTRCGYDDDGNLTAVIRPDGTESTTTYNELGLPVTLVDFDDTVWRCSYDERGNQTAITDPLGATTTYAYDERGRPTGITDALGHTYRVATNPAALPVSITDPLGAVTRYTRDARGRVVAVTDPAGGVTRFGWSAEGKPAWRRSPDGAAERWGYDAEGNLVEHVDAVGNLTRFEVTHFDQPSAKVGPDGARVEFSYDSELRLVAVTNPQGLVWRYDYDALGSLVRETDYNDRMLVYSYDAASQLVERVNGAGQAVRYVRDPLGNVVEQRSGDTVTTFAYDPAGRVIRATNPDADLAFSYDSVGRVLAEVCNGRTLSSSYDVLGRQIRRRTPSGAESVWTYDPAGRPGALRTAGREMSFSYDLAGREVERRFAPDVLLAQTWDTSHRMTSQTVTASEARPLQRLYAYREDGQVRRIEDQPAGVRNFDLDAAGRVTAVHGPGRSERYAYDSAGNITNAVWPSPSNSDSQGAREYTGTLIGRAGNVRYEHDTQGRVVLRQRKRLSAKPANWRYTWDADDRLIGVVTPDGQHWRYRYDALGRRIAKQSLAEDGVTVAEQIDFTWEGIKLAEQTRSGDTTSWDWEPCTLRPVAQTDWIDQQFYGIVSDLIGTPTELIDDDGHIAWQARTTLWGTDLAEDMSDVHCPLRFPGQYADPETGLSYNYFRYYEPVVGRYESNDPLGLAPAPNPMAYVSNPTRELDPLGLRTYPLGGESFPRFVATRDGTIDTASPTLRNQVNRVADHMAANNNTPPPGIRQGGLRGGRPGEWANRDRDLPPQDEGYYHESDVWPGTGHRGSERIVTGSNGEVWYTPDHYSPAGFRRIR